MRVFALVSGGKDSIFSCMKCEEYGHEVVALGNLCKSQQSVDQGESYMFQTQGHEVLADVATCMGLPLFVGELLGEPRDVSLHYDEDSNKNPGRDEVDDLFELIQRAQREVAFDAVCSGAVLSTYQRARVEHVARRLKLESFAFLWQRDQKELLLDMSREEYELHAIIVRVASFGLTSKHLGRNLLELRVPLLNRLQDEMGFHAAGEGGEYESLVLDCRRFYYGKIVLDETRVLELERDTAVLEILKWHVEPKRPPRVPSAARVEHETMLRSYVDALPKHASETRAVSIPPASATTVSARRAPAASESIAQSSNALTLGPYRADSASEALSLVEAELERRGRRVSDVGFVHIYLADMNDFAYVNAEFERVFGATNAPPPARATVELASLTQRVSMLVTLCQSARFTLHVRSRSAWAPQCIGPYSQCNILDDSRVLVAGQIGLDPVTMLFKTPSSVETRSTRLFAQTQQATRNALNVCRSVDTTTVLGGILYLADSWSDAELDEMLSLMRAELEADEAHLGMPEKLLIVGVTRLPRDALVELELVGQSKRSTLLQRWEVKATMPERNSNDDAFGEIKRFRTEEATSAETAPEGWAFVDVGRCSSLSVVSVEMDMTRTPCTRAYTSWRWRRAVESEDEEE